MCEQISHKLDASLVLKVLAGLVQLEKLEEIFKVVCNIACNYH